MSYKTKLQTNNDNLEGNNIDLQSILNTINELPAAGSGTEDLDAEITEQEGLIEQIEAALVGKAAGSQIDTCTIRFVVGKDVRFMDRYYFTKCVDGVISHEYVDGSNTELTEITIENVVCGSFLYFEWVATNMFYQTATCQTSGSSTMKQLYYTQGSFDSCYFSAPLEPNAVCVATFYAE